MAQQKVVISGMSGFIGSHLAKVLSDKNYKVMRITQELLYSPSDLREFFDRNSDISYIFHLAAYGNMSNQKDSSLTVFSNYISAYNMMQASLDVDYKAFIQIGSSSEYGKKSEPMSEKDVLKPETFYGASKAAATHLAYAFSKQYDKPITVVRPFSVYGPGEADFRFIPLAIRKMLGNEAFQCEYTGMHDWIYIDDFIEALLLVADKAKTTADKVINIGSGRSHTNKEVLETLKKISGIQYLASEVYGQRPDDSQVWVSDNTVISRLGWYPKHMIQEGLELTWKYYQDKYVRYN